MFSKYFKSCDQAILRAAVEEVYLNSFIDLSVLLETVLFFKWAGWRLRCSKPSSLLTLWDLENIQPPKNYNEKQETNLKIFDKGNLENFDKRFSILFRAYWGYSEG